jgi:hypothetical protein
MGLLCDNMTDEKKGMIKKTKINTKSLNFLQNQK